LSPSSHTRPSTVPPTGSPTHTMSSTSASTTTLPSQAPGLSHWERFRIRYCLPAEPECHYTWFFTVFVGLVAPISSNCFPLLARLGLHIAAIAFGTAAAGYAYATHVIRKRLRNQYYYYPVTRRARVIRVKRVPRQPHHPQIVRRTICWLEYGDDTNENGDGGVVVAGADTTDGGGGGGDDDDDPVEEEIDESEWADVPCVLCYGEEEEGTGRGNDGDGSGGGKIRVGTYLTVSLVDGDETRPVYLPYQRASARRTGRTAVTKFLQCAAAVVALKLLFWNAPLAFADSQLLEDSINDGWDAFFDRIGLGDDDNVDSVDNDVYTPRKACRIPWFVAACYDALLTIQVVFTATVFVYVRWWKKKNSVLFGGEDDTTTTIADTTYRLLNQGSNHNHNNNNNHSSDREEGGRTTSDIALT